MATSNKKASAAKKHLPARKKTTIKRGGKNGINISFKIAVAVVLLVLLSPFYYGHVLKLCISSWRWARDLGSNPHYHLYKSFNIPIPDNHSIHGIDVSYYQGKIDWKKVKHMHEDSVHISFAFIKATEGIIQVDPYFQRNWRECPKAGIICGAYHYFRPEMNGKWQARFFLQNVKTKSGDLPMAVDIEQLEGVSPDVMRTALKVFLKFITIETNIKPIIYSDLKFYNDNLSGYFSDYSIWLAHYSEPDLEAEKAIKWSFWQHNNKASVNGINGAVDFDVFKGDSLAFRKLLVR